MGFHVVSGHDLGEAGDHVEVDTSEVDERWIWEKMVKVTFANENC